MSNLNKG